MVQTRSLQEGRLYRLPSGSVVAAHPALDETMRFERADGVRDLYTRDEWLDGAFPSLTVCPDGQVATLQLEGDVIVGPDKPLGFSVEDMEPTGQVAMWSR